MRGAVREIANDATVDKLRGTPCGITETLNKRQLLSGIKTFCQSPPHISRALQRPGSEKHSRLQHSVVSRKQCNPGVSSRSRHAGRSCAARHKASNVSTAQISGMQVSFAQTEDVTWCDTRSLWECHSGSALELILDAYDEYGRYAAQAIESFSLCVAYEDGIVGIESDSYCELKLEPLETSDVQEPCGRLHCTWKAHHFGKAVFHGYCCRPGMTKRMFASLASVLVLPNWQTASVATTELILPTSIASLAHDPHGVSWNLKFAVALKDAAGKLLGCPGYVSKDGDLLMNPRRWAPNASGGITVTIVDTDAEVNNGRIWYSISLHATVDRAKPAPPTCSLSVVEQLSSFHIQNSPQLIALEGMQDSSEMRGMASWFGLMEDNSHSFTTQAMLPGADSNVQTLDDAVASISQTKTSVVVSPAVQTVPEVVPASTGVYVREEVGLRPKSAQRSGLHAKRTVSSAQQPETSRRTSLHLQRSPPSGQRDISRPQSVQSHRSPANQEADVPRPASVQSHRAVPHMQKPMSGDLAARGANECPQANVAAWHTDANEDDSDAAVASLPAHFRLQGTSEGGLFEAAFSHGRRVNTRIREKIHNARPESAGAVSSAPPCPHAVRLYSECATKSPVAMLSHGAKFLLRSCKQTDKCGTIKLTTGEDVFSDIRGAPALESQTNSAPKTSAWQEPGHMEPNFEKGAWRFGWQKENELRKAQSPAVELHAAARKALSSLSRRGRGYLPQAYT